jgi:hypothetical protein
LEAAKRQQARYTVKLSERDQAREMKISRMGAVQQFQEREAKRQARLQAFYDHQRELDAAFAEQQKRHLLELRRKRAAQVCSV